MAIFLTGSTGYVGAHVAALLLENHEDRLNLLVRAKDDREAEFRLWRALQIHLDFPRFYDHLKSRISIFRGDLTGKRFGLSDADYRRLIETTDSVIRLRGLTQPEEREDVSQRQPARDAGSPHLWPGRPGIITDCDDSVMSARSQLPDTEPMKSCLRTARSTGAARITILMPGPRSSASTW
ncbi:MAG: SDR family oxidoreductase [Acidobacteria bacterium]|nr:SDR family oxidoreductase [Acidobacteriota bacterium]